LVEAHALLGILAATVEYDWQEAEQQFQLATAGEPVPSYVHWLHAQYLAQIGQYPEAVEGCERALREDPLHLLCRSNMAEWLHVSGRREKAFAHLRQVLEVDEQFWVANWYLGLFEALEGRLTEARIAAERTLTSWNTTAVGLLAGVVARQGDVAYAERLLEPLQSGEPYGVPAGWCTYHLVRLEIDQAASWLAKAIEQGDQRAMYLLPYMRTSSRWPNLAQMLNLPACP
jgi:tetratricopeptide (TPR) repeat protein